MEDAANTTNMLRWCILPSSIRSRAHAVPVPDMIFPDRPRASMPNINAGADAFDPWRRQSYCHTPKYSFIPPTKKRPAANENATTHRWCVSCEIFVKGK
jgi:hypothetical protein